VAEIGAARPAVALLWPRAQIGTGVMAGANPAALCAARELTATQRRRRLQPFNRL